jgi:hypothetical protein
MTSACTLFFVVIGKNEQSKSNSQLGSVEGTVPDKND